MNPNPNQTIEQTVNMLVLDTLSATRQAFFEGRKKAEGKDLDAWHSSEAKRSIEMLARRAINLMVCKNEN
jgi:hypothetical protein